MTTSTAVNKTKALCIATRCASVDQFVATFHRFVDDSSFFVSTLSTRPIGLEIAFAVQLEGGQPVLRGECVVLNAWATPENPFARPGVRLGIRRLTNDSLVVFKQLLAARAEQADGPPGTIDLGVELPSPTPPPLKIVAIPPPTPPNLATSTGPMAKIQTIPLPQVSRPRDESAPPATLVITPSAAAKRDHTPIPKIVIGPAPTATPPVGVPIVIPKFDLRRDPTPPPRPPPPPEVSAEVTLIAAVPPPPHHERAVTEPIDVDEAWTGPDSPDGLEVPELPLSRAWVNDQTTMDGPSLAARNEALARSIFAGSGVAPAVPVTLPTPPAAATPPAAPAPPPAAAILPLARKAPAPTTPPAPTIATATAANGIPEARPPTGPIPTIPARPPTSPSPTIPARPPTGPIPTIPARPPTGPKATAAARPPSILDKSPAPPPARATALAPLGAAGKPAGVAAIPAIAPPEPPPAPVKPAGSSVSPVTVPTPVATEPPPPSPVTSTARPRRAPTESAAKPLTTESRIATAARILEEVTPRAGADGRVPGAEMILPANPLMNLTDESLEGFVDCTLYEDTGTIALDPNEQLDQPAPGEDVADFEPALPPPPIALPPARSLAPPLPTPRPPATATAPPPPTAAELDERRGEPTLVGVPPAPPPRAAAPDADADAVPSADVDHVVDSAPAVVFDLAPAPPVVPTASLGALGPIPGGTLGWSATPATDRPALPAPPVEVRPAAARAAAVDNSTAALLALAQPRRGRMWIAVVAIAVAVIGVVAWRLGASSTSEVGAPVAAASRTTSAPRSGGAPPPRPDAADQPRAAAVTQSPPTDAATDAATATAATATATTTTTATDAGVGVSTTPTKPTDGGDEDPSRGPPVVGNGPCQLAIASTPAGAIVSLDGAAVGPSPLTVAGACGPHKVELAHPRYEAATRALTLAAGAPQAIDVTLQRPTHTLTVLTLPPGATVSIEGHRAGTSPAVVKVMGFSGISVAISKPGFKPVTQRIYSKLNPDRVFIRMVKQ